MLHTLLFTFISDKLEPPTHTFNMGYLVSPYSYANGAPGALPVAMVSDSFFTMAFNSKDVDVVNY